MTRLTARGIIITAIAFLMVFSCQFFMPPQLYNNLESHGIPGGGGSSGSSPTNWFDYSFSGFTASITGLSSAWTNAGEPGNISIPSSINGYSVTSIGASAFAGYNTLTSITIPSSVTSIGTSAFINCSGMTSINIPSSVTNIGNNAFYSCIGLTSITIPSSITSIGTNSFYGCTGLTSINIPSSVTNIESEAFYDCSVMTSITIPSSVTSIEDYAFDECTSLTTVSENATTPPTTGTTIFYNCNALTITVPSGYTGNYSSWTATYLGCSSVIIN